MPGQVKGAGKREVTPDEVLAAITEHETRNVSLPNRITVGEWVIGVYLGSSADDRRPGQATHIQGRSRAQMLADHINVASLNRALDALVESGALIRTAAEEARRWGFDTYYEQKTTPLYLTPARKREREQQREQTRLNHQRADLRKRAESTVLNRHADEVRKEYTQLCRAEGIEPEETEVKP